MPVNSHHPLASAQPFEGALRRMPNNYDTFGRSLADDAAEDVLR